jgi:hypothetical protein
VAAGVFPDFRGGVWRSRLFLPDLSGSVLIVVPDTLDFGVHAAGERDTLFAHIQNIGSLPDTVTGFQINSPFTLSWPDTHTVVVPAGGELVQRVYFVPGPEGDFVSTVTVLHQAAGLVTFVCRGQVPSAVPSMESPLPKSEALSVWPNPGNATFEIRFELPRTTDVRLAVFDVNGRLVETLAEERLSAGLHTRTWQAAAHSSGTYFVRLNTGDTAITEKVLLLK